MEGPFDVKRVRDVVRDKARSLTHALTSTLTNPSLESTARVALNVRTHRTFALPILLYSPTSRCNSRCISCDWWRTDGANDLKRYEVAALVRELPRLRTKLVVFTGGEPLVRDDVFELADLFLAEDVTLHLLTSGLELERYAAQIVQRFSEITISLDGHTAELYRRVRGVDGLAMVERGIRKIKQLAPNLPLRARSTLHRRNFRALPHLIDKAESLGLQQISFLAADATTDSFGRRTTGATPPPHLTLLDDAETKAFEEVIDKALVSHAGAFQDGLVAESGDKLRRLGKYYRAHRGAGPFPEVRCNAPWASAVLESDGTLRPCFFQPPVGNVRSQGLRALLEDEMVRFRRTLKVACDATCQRCVCSLRVGLQTRIE